MTAPTTATATTSDEPGPALSTDLPTDGLQTLLDGTQADARRRARDFLVRHDVTAQHGLATREHRDLVRTWLAALAEEGTFTVGMPADHGGGGDAAAGVAIFETLAHGDLSLLVKAGVHFGLFGGAVVNLGTTAHHDALLDDIISGHLQGCFAMTERGHGSDVADLATTATFDASTDEFVVTTPDPATDFKEWIGNAAEDARMAAVFAQLVVDGVSHGVHCLLVPLRDEEGAVLPGIRITDCGHKMGLNGVDNGRIWFDDVRIPRTNLLDRFGSVAEDGTYTSPIESPSRRFFTMLGTLVQGRVSIAGAALGASKSALAIAVRHGERRTQFATPDGAPITLLAYPTHQRRLLVPLVRTYALHAAQVRLTGEFVAAFESDDAAARQVLEAHAAGMKAVATDHATATIQECRQACGGLGYATENRLAALKADTDVFTTFEGDNTVLLQLVAKSLLSGFRDEFGAMDWRQTASFVASTALDTVVERTSVRTMWQRIRDLVDQETGPEAGLRNRNWQLAMLAWREEHALASLARRMRRGADPDVDEFEVFLRCQPHMLVAARAHVERRAMEAFAEMVEDADDDVGRTLNTMCDLFALATIEEHRGWYQEHNRLGGERAKAVTRMVAQLCTELAPVAGRLVDAFGIPDEVLAAPIAT